MCDIEMTSLICLPSPSVSFQDKIEKSSAENRIVCEIAFVIYNKFTLFLSVFIGVIMYHTEFAF